MDKKRIIANWKSNKTAEETVLFLDSLAAAWAELPTANKEIIILPSLTSLSAAYVYCETEGLQVKIGAQNISSNESGAYTGEVNGKQLSEFCQFVLINHSERRRYNHETDQDARAKVLQALKYGLTPLYCVQDEQAAIPDNVTEIMYEPPTAISTFQENAHADDISHIERVVSVLKSRYPQAHFYYGGSVNPQNIASIMALPDVSGVLVGNSSLDVDALADMMQAF